MPLPNGVVINASEFRQDLYLVVLGIRNDKHAEYPITVPNIVDML